MPINLDSVLSRFWRNAPNPSTQIELDEFQVGMDENRIKTKRFFASRSLKMKSSSCLVIVTTWIITGHLGSLVFAEDIRLSPARKTQRPRVVDLLLGDENSLRGQIRETSGQVVEETVVAIWQGPKLIWKGTVDKAGNFNLPNLSSGLYKVEYGSDQVMVRAWSDDIAPPQASGSLILNREKESTRSFIPRLTPTKTFFPPIWSGTHDDPRLRTRQ